ncbi:MAG TPA: hypothetical protein VN920_12130 [Pyrinomonadaceae bacterium]|jgi:hypothetical protein|nr:hypothetical protein [Pyrinomonadaceae bacterium]
MNRKDEELNRTKGTTDRRVSDKDVKKAGRVNQASNRITQPAQEIADDEVTIAKTGSKP